MIKTLYKYLARHLLYNLLMVFAILCAIIFIIDFMEFAKKFSDNSSVFQMIGYVVLRIFSHLDMSMPFIVLIACIISFFRLNSTNELLVMRTSGISIFRIMMVTFCTFFAVGMLYFIFITPISAYSTRHYQAFENRISQHDSSFVISKTGLWFKDTTQADKTKVINIARVDSKKNEAFGVQIYIYDTKTREVQNIMALSADLGAEHWSLHQVKVTDSQLHNDYYDDYKIDIKINLNELTSSLNKPETLPFWQVDRVIKLAKNSGFSTTLYEMHYYNLLFLPMIFASMAVFSSLFAFGYGRNVVLWKRSAIGLFSGLLIYFANNVIKAFAIYTALPIPFVILAPYLIILLIALYMMLTIEDI